MIHFYTILHHAANKTNFNSQNDNAEKQIQPKIVGRLMK